jgi:hypothetical protein
VAKIILRQNKQLLKLAVHFVGAAQAETQALSVLRTK